MTTYRPGGTRYVAYGAGALMIVMTVAIAVALPAEIRAQFTFFEALTLGATLAGLLAVLHGIGRSHVKVDDDGVEVLNGFRHHRADWAEIKGFSFKEGAPWPTMVLLDDETVMMFALQGSSGRGPARDVVVDLASRVP